MSVSDLVSLAVNTLEAPSPPTPALPGLPGRHLPRRPANPTRSSPRPSRHSRLCPHHATQWGLWLHNPEGRVWTRGAEDGVRGGPLPVDVARTAPQAPLRFGEQVLGWPHSCTWVGGLRAPSASPSACLSPPGPGRGQLQEEGASKSRSAGEAGTEPALRTLLPGPSAATVPLMCGLVWVARCPEVWLSLSPECACVVCACVCVRQCVCACVCAGRSSANPLSRTVHGWRKGVGALGLTVGAGTGVLSCRGPGATPLVCWVSTERGQVPGLLSLRGGLRQFLQ